MKTAVRLTIVLLGVLACVSSCATKDTVFIIRYAAAVNQSIDGKLIRLESSEIETHAQQVLEKNDTKKSKVHSVEIRNIYLQFDSISPLKTKDVSLKKMVFLDENGKAQTVQFNHYFSSIDTNCLKIQLQGATTDLKEMIKGKSFRCQLFFEQGKVLDTSVITNMQLEFLVKGELIKVILHQRILV